MCMETLITRCMRAPCLHPTSSRIYVQVEPTSCFAIVLSNSLALVRRQRVLRSLGLFVFDILVVPPSATYICSSALIYLRVPITFTPCSIHLNLHIPSFRRPLPPPSRSLLLPLRVKRHGVKAHQQGMFFFCSRAFPLKRVVIFL